MIKYEKEFRKCVANTTKCDGPYWPEWDLVEEFIHQCLLRQIDEDNKRFLKKMKNFDKVNKIPTDRILGWSWLESELEYKLRDKVNKK